MFLLILPKIRGWVLVRAVTVVLAVKSRHPGVYQPVTRVLSGAYDEVKLGAWELVLRATKLLLTLSKSNRTS